jgi:hypothetical protein
LYALLIIAVAAVGLGIASLFLPGSGAASTVTPAPQLTATQLAEPVGEVPAVAQVTPTIAVATPWGVLGLDGSQETATAAATEVAPQRPPVVLLGPPPGSQFRRSDTVTFYWDWAETPTDGQRFALYLDSGDRQTLMGTAEAENLGSLQQAGARLSDYTTAPGDYRWYVVVEEAASGAVLAGSERRPIVVLADGSR